MGRHIYTIYEVSKIPVSFWLERIFTKASEDFVSRLTPVLVIGNIDPMAFDQQNPQADRLMEDGIRRIIEKLRDTITRFSTETDREKLMEIRRDVGKRWRRLSFEDRVRRRKMAVRKAVRFLFYRRPGLITELYDVADDDELDAIWRIRRGMRVPAEDVVRALKALEKLSRKRFREGKTVPTLSELQLQYFQSFPLRAFHSRKDRNKVRERIEEVISKKIIPNLKNFLVEADISFDKRRLEYLKRRIVDEFIREFGRNAYGIYYNVATLAKFTPEEKKEFIREERREALRRWLKRWGLIELYEKLRTETDPKKKAGIRRSIRAKLKKLGDIMFRRRKEISKKFHRAIRRMSRRVSPD